MQMSNELIQPQNTEIIMYQTEDGLTKIDVQMSDETVWLTREQMAELFQRDRSVIGKHIKNIFDEGELRKESVWAKFAHTAEDGKVYQVDYYNLDVIISVGYRVKSLRGTQFRIWANSVLKEYLIKGFVMNDELLKKAGGGNYFDELLERIRDIRSSEKVFWRKVLDIYATSMDYDPRMEASVLFFKTVQNKMHWAAHGQTAAEKIYFSADSSKPNMGLYSFSGSHPTQADALVAKNYCNQEELEALNGIVSAYLEFAEMQARRHIPMYMKDWIETLDGFLKLSKHEILTGAGRISAVMAEKKAKEEYHKFRSLQDSQLAKSDKDFIAALEIAEKALTENETDKEL
ncbi:virulence RhuM family protein [Cuneatibacter sp. NSJ-177]|uniref:virulence RhuM family protein n=1 Tax=Cuneatibacter sp. NSJ-177 TaxID=2931401 RepID=UPI001FD17D92|nr:virulence RhuM family protein [Cuneatibacter sp. NSJ-177]MCJ7835728.1 virulence RhuM family protein [Cuneatibacter sp. NSJ-177]